MIEKKPVKKINKRLVIILLLLVISVMSGTFAWFSFSSEKSALVLTIGEINKTRVILSPYQIKGSLMPTNNYDDEGNVYTQIEAINDNNSQIKMSLFYKINQMSDELKTSGLSYTIVKSSYDINGPYEEVVATGNFQDVTTEKTIIDEVIEPKTTVYYRVYLWLINSVDQSSIQNETFDVELNGILKLMPASPVLDDAMIPVMIADDGTVTTIASSDETWYDYDNQKWANVVLVDNDSRNTYLNTTNITVNQSDILAYYVWIPRYAYKIWTTTTGSSPQTISLMFESKDVSMSLGTTVGSWRTHPAFWWDDDSDGTVDEGETVAGIWVGKFETSTDSTSTCYTTSSEENCSNTNQSPRILPNVKSLRYQTISNQFYTSQKVNQFGNIYDIDVLNTNSHMMKNSEWGAAAYLSHSEYGINYEIRINNNNKFTTGCGASEENGAESTSCEIAYGGATSYPQSTTGNITGIFDMSGGAYEYVMGNYDNTAHSTYFPTLPDSKYYDVYLSTQFTGDYSTNMSLCTLETCGGHALSETAGWYDDYAVFVYSDSPWFIRGGNYIDGAGAGAFSAGFLSGGASYYNSWRSVLIPNVKSEYQDIVTISSTNDLSTSQTVTLNWDDLSGVSSYYFGSENPNAATWNEVNAITETTATVDSAETYYFGIEAPNGNRTIFEREFYETSFSVPDNGTLSINSVLTMEGDSFTLPEVTPIDGYSFVGWYTGENGTGTKVTESYSPDSSITLYACIREFSLNISYYTDGGVLDSSTTDGTNSYTWTQESDGLIKLDGVAIGDSYVPPQTINLVDYNDGTYLNITKWAYDASEGAEWICFEGCATENATFNQNTDYEVTDFCDTSSGNCNVKLKVNWSFQGTMVNANRYKWGLYDNIKKLVIYYVSMCYDSECKFTSKYGLSGAFPAHDYDGDTSGTGFVDESSIQTGYTSGTYYTTPWTYYVNYGSCYSGASTSSTVVKTFGWCTSVSDLYLTAYGEDSSNEASTRWHWSPSNNCYFYKGHLYTSSSCS